MGDESKADGARAGRRDVLRMLAAGAAGLVFPVACGKDEPSDAKAGGGAEGEIVAKTVKGGDGMTGTQEVDGGFPSFNVVDWTHSWDMVDIVAYEDDGAAWSVPSAMRVDSVADRGRNNLPLRRDDGGWSGIIPGVKQIPGPLVVERSQRFNGRPAMRTDRLASEGAIALASMLSPVANPKDSSLWFNPPNGYDAPYWGAILCRPANGELEHFGAWDAYNGHLGTTVTIAKGLTFREGHYPWGMTTSLGKKDPWPSSKIEGSDQQTVLVMAKVDGANSFIEINWRDADGNLQTDRTNVTLKSYTAKEVFFGFVHTSYLSAAGLKVGAPTEEELSTVRRWAEPSLPATGELPDEP